MSEGKNASRFSRLFRSFEASIGTIVFGMEDGTVSIFGLVFGVAASAPDAHTVLVAGATGAAAAAVSMMAGTYLDVESSNDQTRVRLAELRNQVVVDPSGADRTLRARLVGDGFAESDADKVITMIDQHSDTKVSTIAAIELGVSEESTRNPRVEAAWMLVTDLFAAAVPVVPFAVLGLGAARIASLTVTAVLLVVLGVGRGLIGHRPVLRTVFETITIAAAAAAAGVLIAKLIA
jgi:VIT1/CCC1 family predicted Fe2+/Mn2+ transporter